MENNEIFNKYVVGKKCLNVVYNKENFILKMEQDDGSIAQINLYHDQNCCETVELHDVIGDIIDLIDQVIHVAGERISRKPCWVYDGSETWTFYTFRTIKGEVTLRWYGTSNGYYSEGVDINVIEL